MHVITIINVMQNKIKMHNKIEMHKENKKEIKETGDSEWAVDLINGSDQIKR
jgi:hypothetical protein